MKTVTGLPAGDLRHPPVVRAPRTCPARRPPSQGRPSFLAACAFLAGLWVATAPATAAAAPHRGGQEVRKSAPARPAAAHARAPQRHAARRPARGARQVAAAPRLRDSAQELIPVSAGEAQLDGMSPRAACLAAVRRAEQVHGMPSGLLSAVALAESGLHAYAMNIGGRAYFPGTRDEARVLLAGARPGASVMAGCVQVNARVHARGSDWPLDPMRSADWAGGMMARWARETGSWSEAVRRWHGGSPASTQRLVCRIKAKMEVTGADADVFRDWSCDSAQTARVRRNGEIHLSRAESAD